MSHHRLPDESSSIASGAMQSPRNQEVVNDNQIKENERRTRNNSHNQQRTNRFKLRPHQVYQKNQQIFENMFTNKYYNFLVIKAKLNENLVEVNVINENSQLESVLKGTLTKINELRDWSLLVEVKDEEQSPHKEHSETRPSGC